MFNTIYSKKFIGSNRVASVIRVIAWIVYLVGIIAGLFFGADAGYSSDFPLLIVLAYWAGFFVAGTMIIGFAEIIDLLQEIVDKIKGKLSKMQSFT